LSCPLNHKKKIEQVLPFELETYLPGTEETYISDFHILDSADDSNLILSASIAESLVEKIFLKLDEYTIVPKIITPLGYAAAIGFLSETSKLKGPKKISDFAFLHATDCEITLVLIKKRKPCAIRTIPNRNISSENLAVMVEQTIIGFNQRTGESTFFDTILCMDEDTHNADQISNAFETNTAARFEPGIKLDSNTMLLNIAPEKAAQYLFNFCRGKYAASSFFKTYFSNIAVSAVLLLCALTILMVGVGFDNKKLEGKIAQLDNKALSIFQTTFPEKTKIYDPYLQMKANVKSFMEKSGTLKNTGSLTGKNDLKIVEIIGELSGKIDDSTDMDISRFLFNKDRLVLSGSTDNFNNVDRIKSKIESSQVFKAVNISSAAADKKGNRVKFKFIIEM
jgi:general secretion pathway protein L